MVALLLFLFASIIQDVYGQRIYFGTGITTCNEKALIDQICPTAADGHDYKYVRIKTYNDKYFYAEPWDNGKVKTRCCGVKDVVGRADVKVPTLRSTFKVHCKQVLGELRPVVQFEVLKHDSTEPSGNFLYAYSKGFRSLKVVEDPDFRWGGLNFVLERWKAGTQTTIMTLSRRTWLGFFEDRDGEVNVHKYPVSEHPVPGVQQRYFIEIIPKDCVETPLNKMIHTAPDGTNVDDCERLPDRCFLSGGWDSRSKSMQPGHCYYRKGSKCFNAGLKSFSGTDPTKKNAKDCEAVFGMCWVDTTKKCFMAADYNLIKLLM